MVSTVFVAVSEEYKHMSECFCWNKDSETVLLIKGFVNLKLDGVCYSFVIMLIIPAGLTLV